MILPLLLLTSGCSSQPDNEELAATESRQAREAANAGRIDCALENAAHFDRSCTVEQMTSDRQSLLVVGRADAGYRRLLITSDGRGVVAADGAEPAIVSIRDNGMIEVRIGADRYRLPAKVKAAS